MSVNVLEISVGIEFSTVTSLSLTKVCSRKKYSKKKDNYIDHYTID